MTKAATAIERIMSVAEDIANYCTEIVDACCDWQNASGPERGELREDASGVIADSFSELDALVNQVREDVAMVRS